MINETKAVLAAASTSEALDVLNKVDAFYNTSWQHLLIYSGILITLLGVIFPLLIQFFQSRAIRREEEASRVKLEGLVKNALQEQLLEHETKLSQSVEVVKKELTANIQETRKDLERQIGSALGNIYLVQGNVMLTRRDFSSAFRSFIGAAKEYCKSKDEFHLRRSISVLLSSCLSN